MLLLGFVSAAPAAAGWSQIESVPGFSGTRPVGMKVLKTEDGRRFLYWTRDVLGVPTIQSMWMDEDGTAGPVTDLFPEPAGRDFQAVMALNGDVTFAWIAPGVPNEVAKSITVPVQGPLRPVLQRTPDGEAGQPIDDLTVTVTPEGALGFSWLRLTGLFWGAQVRTYSPAGQAGAVSQISRWPESATSVSLAARPDGRFKIAYGVYNHETEFFNIASVSLRENGEPYLESDERPAPTDSSATEKSKRFLKYVYDPEKQKIDPVSKQPVVENGAIVMEPSGADGPVTDLELGIYSKGTAADPANGAGSLVWRHKADGTNWRVDSAQFTRGGRPKGGAPISLAGANVTNLRLQSLRDRFLASWLVQKNGDWTAEFKRFKDSKEGIRWRAAADPNFSDVVADLDGNETLMVGWTENALVPGTDRARIFQVSPSGVAWPVELTGQDALKSFSDPVPFAVDDLGSYVMIYGVDQADVGGFWKSSYSNRGIAINPSKLSFGTGHLNVSNGVRRAYVSNPGDTSTTVSDVTLTGPDANDFSLVNPAACVGALKPGARCEIAISFAPGQAGQREARLEVQSDAGAVFSDLTGSAIARTTMSLGSNANAKPVRRGGKFRVKTSVTNDGGVTAESLKLCMRTDKRTLRSPNKCLKRQALAPGETWTATFKLTTKKSARKGAGQPVSFELQATNAGSKRSYPRVKLK